MMAFDSAGMVPAFLMQVLCKPAFVRHFPIDHIGKTYENYIGRWNVAAGFDPVQTRSMADA